MAVALIWAQSTSGVIGRDGGIPWHVPEDMGRFKDLTVGHTVVMGRRTWESLPPKSRPLPGRRNIVISRDPGYRAAGADVVTSVEAALDDPDTWVIGGSQVYHLALPFATRCEVTEVEIDLRPEDDDALGPMLNETWIGTEGPWHDSASGLRYRFLSYLRR